MKDCRQPQYQLRSNCFVDRGASPAAIPSWHSEDALRLISVGFCVQVGQHLVQAAAFDQRHHVVMGVALGSHAKHGNNIRMVQDSSRMGFPVKPLHLLG